MFLRKTTVGREPLPVTMSGVRMGERVLQIGVNDPRIAAAIAAKTGISGHSAMVVTDERAAERARAGAAGGGVLMDVQVAALHSLPHPDASFDVVVVHNRDGLFASLGADGARQAARDLRRVLRRGGRIVAIDAGTRTGVAALLRSAPKPDPMYEAAGGTVGVLTAAGFKPVRQLADRDGYRFSEGLNQ